MIYRRPIQSPFVPRVKPQTEQEKLLSWYSKLPPALSKSLVDLDYLFKEFEQKKKEIEQTFAHIYSIAKGEQGIQGEKGDKGDPGIDGISPVVDYGFIISNVLAQIPTPENGVTPSDEYLMSLIAPLVPKVENGKDAVVDYSSIIREVIALIPRAKDGKDGKNADPKKVADIVLDEIKKKKIKAEHIEGWQDPETILARFHARGGVRGGGDIVSAGSGITITTVNGVKTITATSGGFQNKTELTTTTLDGSTVQTCAFAHTVGTIFLNGVKQILNTDYTVSGSSITFISIFPLGYVENLY